MQDFHICISVHLKPIYIRQSSGTVLINTTEHKKKYNTQFQSFNRRMRFDGSFIFWCKQIFSS